MKEAALVGGRRSLICLIIAFSFSLLLSWPIEARGYQVQPLVLGETTERMDVYPAIEMLKDRSLQYTAREVTSEPFSGQFLSADEIEQKTGFFETATWIRFNIVNESNRKQWLLEFAFPLIHEIRLYIEDESGVTELHRGGANYPFGIREIEHRHFVYELAIEPGESQTYYALATGGGDLHPPINIWQKEAFIGRTAQEATLLGVFYGIVLVMIVYNLFLYISLRMRSYLYYVAAITCTLMGKVSINGLGFQYLWPDQPMWNKLATTFWVSLACIFILMFTRIFLEADQHVPSFRKWTYGLITLNSLVLAILFVSLYSGQVSYYWAQTAMVLASLFTFVTVLITAFMCLKRGARQARFYIAGWLIFLTGVSITILQRSVVLPYSMLTEYAGQAALTAEVVLLSLALADKINIIRREKEIAERQALESQAESIRNLEIADEMKDEFLAVTSHELRTPLYGMIGIAESLQDGIAGKASSPMKEQLSLIIESGRRLTHLLNDIIDLSKLKHSSQELHLKPVDVKGVADLVCAVSMPLVKDKPIRLLNHLDYALPRVWADENRLQQILYNLIGNAIKYTDEGEIVISAQQVASGLAIEVSDTGRGIPQDQLDTIFYPFQQGDDSLDTRMGGAGMGLSIAKRLVELHEGRLEVTSQVGEGSTFRVTIPMHHGQEREDREAGQWQATSNETEITPVTLAEPTGAARTEQLTLVSLPANTTKNRPRVLVADDEFINVQVLMNQLVLEGYEVLTVFQGDDVFNKLDEEEIDLLILDIMMPKMSGYEVCQRLRQTYSLMELPILMLTAKNQLQDKLAAFAVGANDYLVKPCEKQELLSRVRTLVRTKKLNQELTEMNLHLEDKVQERTRALEVVNRDLQKANEKLLTLSASRSDLLANIAHELGSPVTLVHGYVQSLREGLIASDDDHYQQLVLDKINVLSRLIDDLFDLSKLEAGQVSLNKVQIRLDDWMAKVYALCEFAISQGGRRYGRNDSSPAFEQFICELDSQRMDQVFTNLISNAVKHTVTGSGEIAVEATLSETNQLTIKVKDNGVGIPEEELPYIFERFYKVQQTSSRFEPNGTGLGLAIVKQIVEGHQGKVWAESRVNEGTSICFTLPVFPVE